MGASYSAAAAFEFVAILFVIVAESLCYISDSQDPLEL